MKETPIEYADLKRPRPSTLARLAERVLTTRPRDRVRFTRPEPRRTLRELEQQAWEMRWDKLMRDQRVMDELANRRERRIRPTLSDLHERLRAKMR